MKHNLKVILLLLKLKITRLTVFRLSFFGGFFADGTMFLVQLLTFHIIYGQVESIGGWARGEMLIFIGTFAMLNGLSMTLCFFGLITIPRKIREGGLDHYLTKPVSPLLRLAFEEINLGSAPLVLQGGMIVAYGVSVLGLTISLPLALGYTALVLLMALLYCDLELIIRTVPFFVISASALEHLEGDMIMLNFKVPGVLYEGFFKFLFCFILPYGLMATVPTELLAGTLTTLGLIYALGIVAGFTAFALWFWKLGLKNYKSASS